MLLVRRHYILLLRMVILPLYQRSAHENQNVLRYRYVLNFGSLKTPKALSHDLLLLPQCEEGNLPLHEALSTAADKPDAPQISVVLLEAFPDAVNATTDEGLLPIHLAAMSGFSSGLRTLFAYNFKTIECRECTELMLPIDFAVDGYNSEEVQESNVLSSNRELLSVAHLPSVSRENAEDKKSNFISCIEILLSSAFYGRPILNPRNPERNEYPFLPLHGAVTARPLLPTWKTLLSIYSKDHISDEDKLGRTIAHALCVGKSFDEAVEIEMAKDMHRHDSDLFSLLDNYGFLPLHLCLLNENTTFDFIRTLMEFNRGSVDVEINGSFESQYTGFTAYQVAAASNCDLSIIFFLMTRNPTLVNR